MRGSKHIRKELKKILGLQLSLCPMLLCLFGVSWTFYVNKDKVSVKLWDPCIVLLGKQNRPKGCDGYMHSSIHSHRRPVSRKECIWCPSERKDNLGSLNRKEANVCWNVCIYFPIHKFNPSSPLVILPPKTHIHLIVNQKMPQRQDIVFWKTLQKNHSTFSPGEENYFSEQSRGTLLNVSSESHFSVVWFKVFFQTILRFHSHQMTAKLISFRPSCWTVKLQQGHHQSCVHCHSQLKKAQPERQAF